MKSLRSAILVLATLLLVASPVLAQPLVAVVVPGNLPRYQEIHKAFTDILAKAGFSEEKVKLVVQKPNADNMSLANSIRRMASAGAKVIITYGSQATAVAVKEAPKSPLIFADVYDPVGLDIVKTMESPGVNRTGAGSKTIPAVLINILGAIKPVARIGILYNGEEAASVRQKEEFAETAAKAGIAIETNQATSSAKLATALDELLSKVDAIYLTECFACQEMASDLVARAAEKKIPVIGQFGGLAEAGGLLSLEVDAVEQGNLTAVDTLQVLNGKDPLVLAVRPATKHGAVLNMKSAAALGISVSPAAKAKAQRIIE